MTLDEALVAALVGVPAYDWLMVTSSAARMPSFDYRYWPMSRWRIATITLLAAGIFFTILFMKPPESARHLWILLPAGVALLLHGGIAMIDIFAQRRLAVGPDR